MDLSISIVSWNTRDLLDQCLESVYATTDGIEFEVIVVDNRSSDGSAEMVRARYPQVRLIENSDNAGFAKANNQAYALSTGRHFMLLNPDTICLSGALPSLVSFMDGNPSAGAVGPLVLNPDGGLQHSWARFPTLLNECLGRLDRRIASVGASPVSADETRQLGPFRTDWVGGCALVIRRDAVERIGRMDESLFMYSEETDWCLRLHKAGWEVWVDPRAEIVHLGGQSSKQVAGVCDGHLRASKVAYFCKHHGVASGFALSLGLAARRLLRTVLIGGGRHG